MTTSLVPGLRDVLPAAIAALGATEYRLGGGEWQGRWALPHTDRVCVVLVDGMGLELLRDHYGYARFLGRHREWTHELRCDFPATTATSMGSFGTGLPPGAHGMLGFLVRDPASDGLLNELAWNLDIDPQQWQPHETAFGHVAKQGVSVSQIGPDHFANSGLTEAALRGAAFIHAATLSDRVDAAVRQLRQPGRQLVYLYWGLLDKLGHKYGADSEPWRAELESVDAAIRQLVERMPRDTVLLITSDHGMVDVPMAQRLDLDTEPVLAQGVRYLGGDSRAPMVYCEPDQAEAVKARWQERLHEVADIKLRAEAIEAGWFGQVDEDVHDRIGDVVASIHGIASVHHTRDQGDLWHTMVGMHGARTDTEQLIPLVVIAGPAHTG